MCGMCTWHETAAPAKGGSGRIRRKRSPLNMTIMGVIADRVSCVRIVEEDNGMNHLYMMTTVTSAGLEELTMPRLQYLSAQEEHLLELKNRVWTVKRLPMDKEAISTKWAVKETTLPVRKLKARFTSRGFPKRVGVDFSETYAPVTQKTHLRVFMSIVAIISWVLRSLPYMA